MDRVFEFLFHSPAENVALALFLRDVIVLAARIDTIGYNVEYVASFANRETGVVRGGHGVHQGLAMSGQNGTQDVGGEYGRSILADAEDWAAGEGFLH
jgi:hypothetical protein